MALGITYAYWLLTRQQDGENLVNSACLKISFTDKNDITLNEVYPMKPEELNSFLSTATPYHFTIHNECNNLAGVSINLESLNGLDKVLEDDYIDVLLYENDYNVYLNKNKQLTSNPINDANKVIKDSKHAYSLYNFTLKANEERDFNLLLYMDSNTPMEEDNMEAVFEGKITLSAEYAEDTKMLRKISSSDSNGMWGYKDKLTKIEIENTKSEKVAPVGGSVYGPFDESENGTKAVESYVVCESNDENCIGYLQSDGKVKANPDSSYLFSGFSSATIVNGFENLDTSNVTNMSYMFGGSKFTDLDLSSFNTSKLTNVGSMFGGEFSLQSLNISNWDLSNYPGKTSLFGGNFNLITIDATNLIFPKDSSEFFSSLSGLEEIILTNSDTSHVTNMNKMFNNCRVLSTLDVTDFDTRNVTDMSSMFSDDANITSLNLSKWKTNNLTKMNNIFIQMTNLNSLNLSNWDLSNVEFTSEANLFFGNNKLNDLYMNSVKFPQNCKSFFGGHMENLQNLYLYGVDTTRTTNMESMFSSMGTLANLDLSYFDTTNVTNMNFMFSGSPNLKKITFGSKFIHNLSATTNDMFSYCGASDRPTDQSWQGVFN